MATYTTLITNSGLAKISAALAGGPNISLPIVAVGDAMGGLVYPNQNQTTLIREVYRASANMVTLNSAGHLAIELVIPQTVGGFQVREIGVFDSDGDLFAVGSTPVITKPTLAENAAAELVLRLIVAISNAAVVNLTAGSTIIATRDWVSANFAIGEQLNGGTTGQVLTKASNADGDTFWDDPANASVVVNTIEETQTLAAGQTVVTLEVCTTTGLAVYLDGVRLPRERWVANSATQITLASSYGTSHELTMVQNEPAAGIESVRVGQVIMLGVSTPPAQLFGYGTWQQVAKGRAVFGFDVEDPLFSIIRGHGGSVTHSHTGQAQAGGAHTHSINPAGLHSHGNATGGTALILAQMPTHAHGGYAGGSFERGGGATAAVIPGITRRNNGTLDDAENVETTNNSTTALTTPTGGGLPHSHPINADGNHSHTMGNTGTHIHELSVNGASSLPPYEILVLWLRTA